MCRKVDIYTVEIKRLRSYQHFGVPDQMDFVPDILSAK